MHRVAFKMTLYRGFVEEYKSRHDALWPEIKAALKDAGVSDYSIFIDEETHTLIGVLKVRDQKALEALPDNAAMHRWWEYMSDIMETNSDNSPVTTSLKEVFHLD